jgi:hypothetical protein
MFHIVFTILCVLAAWKWGDRHNWKLYYPTILFVISGHYIYEFISYNKPLWLFESRLLGHTLSSMLIAFIVYPSLTIIYLPHFPKKILRMFFYISAWVLFISTTEYVSFFLGYFSYHNGWNIWWSLLFNTIWFPMVRLHHEKPILGVAMAAVVGKSIMLLFKIPLP